MCFSNVLRVLLATTPWFEAYRENFLQSMPASEHEFLNHYLACILLMAHRPVQIMNNQPGLFFHSPLLFQLLLVVLDQILLSKVMSFMLQFLLNSMWLLL